jgi:predicted nucleic acid-binding protein
VLVVTDASAAVQLASAEIGFTPLRGVQLIAPPLLWSEAVSTLHQGLWRGAIDAGSARVALGRLLEAPIETRAPLGLRESAWQIAEELGWAKTYDAEYVALAQLTEAHLLTIDARLVRALGSRVRLLDPTSL